MRIVLLRRKRECPIYKHCGVMVVTLLRKSEIQQNRFDFRR